MARFRNIRVPKSGGGYRTQRAMVLSSGKLKFVKGGAGKSKHRRKKSKKRRSHHHTKGHHVAKRRRHHSKRRGGGRRRSHGSRGWMPDRETLYLTGGAAAFGWLEGKSKQDPSFFLNKVPKPIAALGWAGNTALLLHVANKLVKNRYLGYLARGSMMVAGYQLGRKGAAFTGGDQFFTVSGDDYLSGDEAYLDDNTMGALAAEAEMSGVPFDDAVHDAVAHT